MTMQFFIHPSRIWGKEIHFSDAIRNENSNTKYVTSFFCLTSITGALQGEEDSLIVLPYSALLIHNFHILV